jgi:hypothetical protein
MEVLVKQYEKQTNELADTIEYHRLWKEHVDEKFMEQDRIIRRLHFRLGIPVVEETPAGDMYDSFNEE